VKAVPLSEVCRIVNGGTPKSGIADYWEGDVNWLTPAEMGKLKSPSIGQTARTITQAGLKNSSARQVPVGAVIMSTRAPIGHLAIPEVPMAFNQGCRGLVPNERLNTKYLYYFLFFSREALNDLGTGATFKELASSALGKFQIPLPSLEEQRRIVAVLDEAFAAIATATANAEKNIVNARELFECELDREVGWQKHSLVQLESLADEITDGDHQPPPKSKSGVPFITISNIHKDLHEIDFSDTFLVSRDYYEGLSPKRQPRAGDILYTVTGSFGIPVVVEGRREFCFQRHVGLIRPKPDVDSRWLYYVLRSRTAQRQADGAATGAAQRTVGLKALRNFSVPSIPREEQQRIARQLGQLRSEVEHLRRGYAERVQMLAALKQSLLHRAFCGELTSKAAAVVAANDNFATPEFAAKIVAFAYERHVAKNRVRNFGTVKAEKILHMVEAVAGIDLGRQPLRDAAGPDDAQHRHATWDWASSRHFFRFNKRSSGGYDFEKLSSYSEMIKDARTAIAGSHVAEAIELLVDMDRDFAELIATTYAAWNNLIIDQCAATDDAIVLAARDNWHRDKLRFDPSRFHDAIRFIRNNSIVPDGTAKRVGGQEALLF